MRISNNVDTLKYFLFRAASMCWNYYLNISEQTLFNIGRLKNSRMNYDFKTVDLQVFHTWNFIPGFHPEVSLTVYTLSLGWNLIPEWTHPFQKDGWNFIPGWKKEKKISKPFIPGWNFTMSLYLLNFWRMHSIYFPTLSCLNIMKVTRNVL